MSVTISGSNGIEVPAGSRIRGDFSNATLSNRVLVQTSITDGNTSLGVAPNGSGVNSNINLYGSSDPDNASCGQLVNASTDFRLAALKNGTGSYLPITFFAGGFQRMKINTDGRIVIGPTDIGPRGGTTLFSNFGSGVSDPNLALVAVGTAQGQKVGVTFVPTFVGTGDNGPRRAADIWASFDGIWGTEKLSFGVGVGSGVSNDASLVTTERLILSKDGVMAVNGAVLGYGPGSYGTVTQDTSKATTVTLNKPSGVITMHNASLAAGASVTFSVQNTYVVGDRVVISPLWTTVNPASYRVELALSGVGVFSIRVTNITAGALSEAIAISFAVLKGGEA